MNQLKRVLFVCVGNACRSQMAEGFARVYGSDVMVAASAGLGPATRLSQNTVRAMEERGVDIKDHFPKSLQHLARMGFDIVVNMSGYELPFDPGGSVLYWAIPDPVAMTYEKHCEIRDQVEGMVMRLIIQLRQEEKSKRAHKRAV